MRYFSCFSWIWWFELWIQYAYLSNSERKKQGLTSHDSANDDQQWLSQQQPCCVWFSEIDKYATQIYQSHFPNHKPYGDITKIIPEDLPDFDCLVGWFPCQSFSIAGKREWFSDTRGTLFFEIATILKAKQPRLCVLENVKWLLSHDDGRTFKVIIATLTELGYDLQWQVLNSKNHWVPQNRERVFIIGHLRGSSRPKVFPFRQTDGSTHEGHDQGNPEIACTLRSRYWNWTWSHIKQLNNPRHSNDRVYGADGISPTLNTMQGGG